jgi:hypothetical protein
MATLGDLVLKLTADADGLVRELKTSEDALDKFAAHVERSAHAITAALVAISAAKLTSEIVALTREMGALAERTEHVSQITGIAAQTLESWSVALERSHTSQDALARSMVTLANQLGTAGDATSETSRMLQALEIDLATVGSTEHFIALLADRFVTMADGVEKTGIATHFLGRGALELIPLLNQGSHAIEDLTAKAREMGLVLTDLQRHELTAVDDAFDDLGLAIKGLKTQIAADFAPTVKLALEGLTALIVGITTGFQQLGVRLADVVNTINFMAQSILSVGDALLSLDVFTGGGLGRLKERLSGIKDEARAIHELAKAEHAAIGAGLPRDAALAAKLRAGGIGGLSDAELKRLAGLEQEAIGRGELHSNLWARMLEARAAEEAAIGQTALGNAELHKNLWARMLEERAAREAAIGQTALGNAELHKNLWARMLEARAAKEAGIDQEALGRAELHGDLWKRMLDERAAKEAGIDQEALGRAELHGDLWKRMLEERAAKEAGIDQEGLGRAQLYNDLWKQRLEERAAKEAANDQEALGRAQEQLGQFIQRGLLAERPRFVAAEDLALAQQMADLTGQSFHRAALEIQLTTHAMQQMLRDGVDPTSAGIQEMAARLKDLEDQEAIKREFREIGQTIAGTMQTMVQGVALGTQTMEQLFKNMVRNILVTLASRQLERGIVSLFDLAGTVIAAKATGGASLAAGSTSVGGLSVPGQAFTSSFLSMPGFAEGAYVTRPTFALFGEKEPEYAVPESKVPGFVRAMGGGGDAPIHVTVVYKNPIDPAMFKTSPEEMVQVWVGDVEHDGPTRRIIKEVVRG